MGLVTENPIMQIDLLTDCLGLRHVEVVGDRDYMRSSFSQWVLSMNRGSFDFELRALTIRFDDLVCFINIFLSVYTPELLYPVQDHRFTRFWLEVRNGLWLDTCNFHHHWIVWDSIPFLLYALFSSYIHKAFTHFIGNSWIGRWLQVGSRWTDPEFQS